MKHNQSQVVVCRHVNEERAEVETLLVGDDGAVEFALCATCGSAKRPHGLPHDTTKQAAEYS